MQMRFVMRTRQFERRTQRAVHHLAACSKRAHKRAPSDYYCYYFYYYLLLEPNRTTASAFSDSGTAMRCWVARSPVSRCSCLTPLASPKKTLRFVETRESNTKTGYKQSHSREI